ncbi:hypothetical protein H4CHR_02933 [Variovorax sp. PBS-H4]|uniref:DUF2528 family protein n=1 Tax=Variovorax sp. PBS-H4 TaxID=434008 RepID=UPI001317B282|nr:DUF2528 family protein [Variovorax sp. PBS-H4]VTU32056.1 hypothetical protein H4CHR_02933 [Variovorax sp. PBS-H4]
MTLRRFSISDRNDNQVTIEIDTDVLTEDLAHEVNNFLSGAKERLAGFDDEDIYACVAMMAAHRALLMMMADGGALFPTCDSQRSDAWTADLLKEEGMPSAGVRIASAYVEVPDFDELEVHEE